MPPSEPDEEPPLPDPVAEEPPVEEPPVEEPPCFAARGGPPRVADRDEPVDDDETDDPDELDELTPVEPAEPVVSAKATAGIDAIAAPTPKATANAPTRPTKRDEPDPTTSDSARPPQVGP